MPLTIWQHAGRRCTVSIRGVSIAVQLLDGEERTRRELGGSRRSPWLSCGGANRRAAHSSLPDESRETFPLPRSDDHVATVRPPCRESCGSIADNSAINRRAEATFSREVSPATHMGG